MKKPFVFISYSTKESDAANLVHSYLEGNGINCWIASRNIGGGESFAVQIVDAIQECDVFVMIASDNSNASNHVGNELSIAFTEKKPIIPFRLQEFKLSKANSYFLQQAQWINAYEDMNGALKQLLLAVRAFIDTTPSVTNVAEPAYIPQKKEQEKNIAEPEDDTPALSREEIVDLLLDKIEKFPYQLRKKAYGEGHDAFRKKANILFENTLSMYFKGKPTAGGLDYVDIIVDTLSQGQGISMQIKGLPGCAKNMLIQLAYYKMLERFRCGASNYLPVYLSSSYYEKLSYTPEKEREEMTDIIKEETKEFFSFVKKNPEVRPVLMLEAVREHIVAKFAPEDVIGDLFKKFGKFNRIVAVDVGLINNRSRHKRTIPLIGDALGYSFVFHSIPITDKKRCIAAIRAILDMYIEQYESLDENDVYRALMRLCFTTVDIFVARLIATELAQGQSADDISIVDMYERLALIDIKGDEDKMLTISNELYEYIYNESHKANTKKYNAVLWSLPHKHNTYLEFMISYHFTHSISVARETGDFSFLKVSMTAMENHFTESRLTESYTLQEALLSIIVENYEKFSVSQKSNAAFWLGKITYAELSDTAEMLLEREYKRLFPLVKTNNRQTLENRQNQYLFRSVCNALIEYGRTKILDEYLCLIVINDIANAINRGMVIQYHGGGFHVTAHNDFYLDDNINKGEQAIRILCSRVESKMTEKRTGYVENELVSLLTLVQARMHTAPEKLSYNLTPYCEKCLFLLDEYQKRPRSVVSDKLLYYFQTTKEDIESYLENSRFDAAMTLFTSLSKMREVKRTQWLEYGIEDPESVAEHTMGAWMLAMIFLPSEYSEENYNKQEILDMLMVHDMADSLLGDCPSSLSEPTKELKRQNVLMRKLFLKGTYPEVANMTHYYNVWTGYYNGQNINARIARDINLIQTANTFFEYFSKDPLSGSVEQVKKWLGESNKLSTDLGYDLFERIILRHPKYRKATDALFTAATKNDKK